jgi:hypothetical protein
MAFTYVGDLSTDRDKVRFYIQDTVENSGPKPSDGNFTDAEIDGLLTVEGNWPQAVAAAYEVLEAAWAGYADWQAGPRRESASQIAERYGKKAEVWRDKELGGVATLTRTDAYTDDTSEYT